MWKTTLRQSLSKTEVSLVQRLARLLLSSSLSLTLLWNHARSDSETFSQAIGSANEK